MSDGGANATQPAGLKKTVLMAQQLDPLSELHGAMFVSPPGWMRSESARFMARQPTASRRDGRKAARLFVNSALVARQNGLPLRSVLSVWPDGVRLQELDPFRARLLSPDGLVFWPTGSYSALVEPRFGRVDLQVGLPPDKVLRFEVKTVGFNRPNKAVLALLLEGAYRPT